MLIKGHNSNFFLVEIYCRICKHSKIRYLHNYMSKLHNILLHNILMLMRQCFHPDPSVSMLSIIIYFYVDNFLKKLIGRAEKYTGYLLADFGS